MLQHSLVIQMLLGADSQSPGRNLAPDDASHKKRRCQFAFLAVRSAGAYLLRLTWLVLGEDPAARSHRVEQFTAL